MLCQFSKREVYSKLEELIGVAVKDRSDVLPEELLEEVIENFSEIPMFDGIDINNEEIENEITREILRCAEMYKKDLDFQIMVSIRRKDLRLKQKLALEDQEIDL